MKNLLRLFNELSLHPRNAKALKGLILQLAIQGKLSNKSDVYKKVTLKDIGTWAIGNGFPKKEQGIDNQEILFAKVSDFNLTGNEKYIRITNNTISRDTADNNRIKIHPEGTVVFPKIGGAIATNKRRIIVKPTAIDNNCLGIIPGKYLTKEWLFLVLSSIDFTIYQSGTSVPSLSQKIIGEIEVSLPPLQEQKAIVSIVQELFTEVEQLEQKTVARIQLKKDYVTSALQDLAKADDVVKTWQDIQPHFKTFFNEKANIKQLRETILQLAVKGKLTSNWRKQRRQSGAEVEPASELLQRIKAEKQKLIEKKKIKKEKPLSKITEDDKPFALPDGWEWCRLGNYTHYGALAKYENKDANESTWVLELEDIEKRSSKLLKKVRFDERDFKSTKSTFKSSDVIYGKLRPYLDKVIVADEEGVCTTEMIPIKSFDNCSPQYLRWFLKYPDFIVTQINQLMVCVCQGWEQMLQKMLLYPFHHLKNKKPLSRLWIV